LFTLTQSATVVNDPLLPAVVRDQVKEFAAISVLSLNGETPNSHSFVGRTQANDPMPPEHLVRILGQRQSVFPLFSFSHQKFDETRSAVNFWVYHRILFGGPDD
jgi:hypothetical protein